MNHYHRRLARRHQPPRAAVRLVTRAAALGLPLGWVLRWLSEAVLAAAARLATEVVTRLAPTSKSMEYRFLHCSNMLEDLSVHTGSLMRDSAELISLATGRADTEQIIRDTIAVLDPPLAYLDDCIRGLRERAGSLRKCTVLVEQLLDAEAALQEAVSPLRATQTMFRVEAARLPEEARAYFASLSSRIEALQAEVRESFRGEFERLSKARGEFRNLTSRIEEESLHQHTVLERERHRIENAVDHLRHELETNSGREVQLKAKSDSVAAASSRIIVALQSQDIVAQRLEHVFEALRTTSRISGELNEGVFNDSRAAISKMQVLIELQAAQLDGIRAQIAEAGGTVSSSCGELVATIESFDRECVFLNDFSEVTAAANGTIQTLLDMIEQVDRMLAACRALVGDSLRQVASLGAATGHLTGSVEDLSRQMNLIALNAQIQAVHIGEGTGLEILAAHTAAIATETARIGESMSGGLAELREQTESQRIFFERFSAAGVLQTDYMAAQGRAHENRLHAARDLVLNKLSLVGRSVEGVVDAAGSIRRAAAQSSHEERAIAQFHSRLTSLAAVMDESLGTPADAGAADPQHHHYTMSSERDTHRAVLARRNENAREAASSPAPEPARLPAEEPPLAEPGAPRAHPGDLDVEFF